MARRKQPNIPDEILDRLLAGGDPRDALAGKDGLLDALKKALAERALNAEMDQHLEGGEPDGRANSRNGYGVNQRRRHLFERRHARKFLVMGSGRICRWVETSARPDQAAAV
jgi:hypothetical protein